MRSQRPCGPDQSSPNFAYSLLLLCALGIVSCLSGTAQLPVVAAAPAQSTSTANKPSQVVSEPPTLTLNVDTKLTVEDVTVSDGHHRPVHGLERSSFTLKEDGKPQTIQNFEEYGVAKPAPQAAPPQLPPNTYTNAQPATPSSGAVNILLMDSVTTGLHLVTIPENVTYPKREAIKYLKNMPSGTQAGIFEFGSGVHLVQGVTADREVLLAAMNTITYKLAPGSSSRPPADLDDVCRRGNTQSQQVLDALEQVAASLSGIKGRKNLIWFTPGIPWLTDYPTYKEVRCLGDYTAQLHRVYELLNAAHVSLYPVDGRGLVAQPMDTTPLTPFTGKITGPAVALAASSFSANIFSENMSLQAMADATGGAAYFNRNDLDSAVDEAITTGADYYALSYVPPRSRYDGQYHTIDVKVDRQHLNLQYRPGYNSIDPAKSPNQPASAAQNSSQSAPVKTAAFDAAMGHGTTPSTQLLFDVSIAPATSPAKPGDPVIGTLDPSLKGKPLTRYDLSFTLPADQIALADEPDGTRKVAMEFVVAVYDAAGKMLNYHGQWAKIALKPEQVARFTQQTIPVKMQIDLPAGKIFVRTGVLDVSSQKVGTLEVPETVAK